MNIQSVVSPDITLCAYTLGVDGRENLSDDDQSLQVAVIPIPSGRSVEPHIHNPIERYTKNTQECWVVLSGTIKVCVFDVDELLVTTININAGTVFVTFAGGHSLTALTDAKIVEIKNGPYFGRLADYRIFSVQK